MFNTNKSHLPAVAIEYRAPHFIVLIRSPGQSKWIPVRSATRKVTVQNEFGTAIKTYAAIEPFPTQAAAEQWVELNVPNNVRKARPQEGGLRSLFSFSTPDQFLQGQSA
jgi:hypothetical protein